MSDVTCQCRFDPGPHPNVLCLPQHTCTPLSVSHLCLARSTVSPQEAQHTEVESHRFTRSKSKRKDSHCPTPHALPPPPPLTPTLIIPTAPFVQKYCWPPNVNPDNHPPHLPPVEIRITSPIQGPHDSHDQGSH